MLLMFCYVKINMLKNVEKKKKHNFKNSAVYI
jgi:hypothetical protein